jgi:hypothetical protein
MKKKRNHKIILGVYMALVALKQNPIYKVNYLSDIETIKSIHVFFGPNRLNDEDMDDLFRRDPTNAIFIDENTGQLIFTEVELKSIREKEIPVFFSELEIHYDDTIHNVKLKIVEAMGTTFAIEEMYLFCLKQERLYAAHAYQTLTQNGKLSLTRVRLDQFFTNVVYDSKGNPVDFDFPEKSAYEYDDILELNINGKDFYVAKPLGQKFFIVENEYPFVVNPFDVEEYDSFIERASRRSLTTLNSHLLLNTGPILNNNIYLCLAEDVYQNAEFPDTTNKTYTANIYFPFLAQLGIATTDTLSLRRDGLVDSTRDRIDSDVLSSFKAVDLFYDMYKGRKENLQYQKSGLRSVRICIHPLFRVKLPLDVIFKLIHATDGAPLIKYNPGQRQENIFRLYTEQMAKDGRKIPHLARPSIFKLMKTIGKRKSVSVVIEVPASRKNTIPLVCDFEESGDITVSCEFETIFPVVDLDDLIRNAVNPIIEEVKGFLEQSGYSMSLFKSILDDNVEVERLDYETNIHIERRINLNEMKGCLSSVFVVETKDFDKGIVMRFKRVSNFSKLNSIEAFVVDQVKQKNGLKNDELVLAMVENYGVTEEAAMDLLARLASELQVERSAKRSQKIEIKINPGFKTSVTVNKLTSVLTIRVDGLNDINYLYTVPIYLDTFVRLSQDRSSSNVPLETIKAICGSRKRDDVEDEIDDVVAVSEESFLGHEIPVIEDEEVRYIDFNEYQDAPKEEGRERTKTVLDLFFGDDDDNEDARSQDESGTRQSYSGGAKTSSSSSLGPIVNVIQASSSSSDETKKSKDFDEFKEEEEKEDAPERDEVRDSTPLDLVAPARSNTVKNIDGMKLSTPNPFQVRMEALDPILFNNPKQNGKFHSYSRSCLHSSRKQPVILTEEEMQKIEKDQPGFLATGKKNGDILKYGSKPDNQYYYMCPRYWCLKTNSPISEEDVKSGKCGKIIPRSRKEVRPGEYVFEFFDKAEHGTQQNYIKHYPGFLEKEKHPEGLCMPCCFKNWQTPVQIERRRQCAAKDDADVDSDGDDDDDVSHTPDSGSPQGPTAAAGTKKTKKTDKEDYIIGPEKSPIPPRRWGYLPMSIQTFLRENSATCQISKTNTNVKQFHTCLLRHGVQHSTRQSFIASIADAKFYGEGKIRSIKEMKTIITDALTLDLFVTLQNGDLITVFQQKHKTTTRTSPAPSRESSNQSAHEPYMSTKLFQKVNKSNPKDMAYFNNVKTAFENFISFLRDDDVEIDYTYLWDIVCRTDSTIFKNGLNLVILEISNSDTTNNVEMICPTNHYSAEFYDSRKRTLILLKNGDFYEPIYSYRNEGKKTVVGKTFSEFDPQISKSMRYILKKLIKPLLKQTCSPLLSLPNVYKFKSALPLTVIVELLSRANYDITKQVVNYQGKVISVVCQDPNGHVGVVPCFPSAIDKSFDFVYMSDDSMYQSYQDTVDFLEELSDRTQRKIPSRPEFKVTEDEMVVGILTETNQFVQVKEPVPLSDITDDIKVLKENNYLIADATTALSKEVDTERVSYIRKIKLETNFYNVFRNTIRILLNKYENIKLREKIEADVKDIVMLYMMKLNQVIEGLRELVDDSILFSDEYDYEMVGDISTCIVLEDENKCNGNRPLCAFSTGNGCQLVLPKRNLLTGTDNETFYFGKMADELIRYSRINSFIFKPETYLSFGQVNYNLRDSEIVVLQSLLTSDYFDGLVPEELNKYASFNTFDSAQPSISQVYENKHKHFMVQGESANDDEDSAKAAECAPQRGPKVASVKWRKCFDKNYSELIYMANEQCGYYMLIDTIRKARGVQLTVTQLKTELLAEYAKFVAPFRAQVVDVLIAEGKRTRGREVQRGSRSFQHFILDDDYFITNLDIWLMVEKYEIPTILLSLKPLLQTKNEQKHLVLYGDETSDAFVFIIAPTMKTETVPGYKVVESPDQSIFIPLDDTSCEAFFTESVDNKISIKQFLENFKKKAARKERTKPRLRLIEDSPTAEEEVAIAVAPAVRKETDEELERDIFGNGSNTSERALPREEEDQEEQNQKETDGLHGTNEQLERDIFGNSSNTSERAPLTKEVEEEEQPEQNKMETDGLHGTNDELEKDIFGNSSNTSERAPLRETNERETNEREIFGDSADSGLQLSPYERFPSTPKRRPRTKGSKKRKLRVIESLSQE